MRIAMAVLATALAWPGAIMGATARRDQKPAATCRPLPAGKRVVRLSLKPNTTISDLIVWISSVTCKQFIFSGEAAAAGKTVTIISPQLITPEEAYRLFLDALDSVGLTVYPTGRFLRIIELGKGPRSPIPVVIPPG